MTGSFIRNLSTRHATPRPLSTDCRTNVTTFFVQRVTRTAVYIDVCEASVTESLIQTDISNNYINLIQRICCWNTDRLLSCSSQVLLPPQSLARRTTEVINTFRMK